MKLNLNNYKGTLKAFNLPEFWEGQLLSKRTKNKGVALRILDDMSKDTSSAAISKKAISESKDLRKHAKSIFMNFDSNNAFRFLEDDFDIDFNALDEVRIHRALKEKAKEKQLPQLIRYVNRSKETDFIVFLINEIGLFQQKESAQQLIDIFIKAEDEAIKSQIVKTIGMLDYKPAVEDFIKNFDYNSQKVQDRIIDTLGILGGEKTLNFLENKYHQTHNKETVIKILENIYKIENGKAVFNKLKSAHLTDFEKSVFAYIEQEYSLA